MKKWLLNKWSIGIGIIAILVLGVWIWASTSDSSVALMFSGAMKETVESKSYAVPASGTNLRVYRWTDETGMVCVGVYSQKSGSWGDCEFPPVK